MHLSTGLFLSSSLLISYTLTPVISQSATVKVIDTSRCRERNQLFPDIVKLSASSIRTDPPNPKVPGCFKIIANANITEPLEYLAAEIELQLVDWDTNPLPCQQGDKNCGGEGSCNICNFCDGLKYVGASVRATNTTQSVRPSFPRRFSSTSTTTTTTAKSTPRPQQSRYSTTSSASNRLNFGNRPRPHRVRKDVHRTNEMCNIAVGSYELSAEICTPDAETIADYLPVELLQRNDQRAERYRYNNPNMNFDQRRLLMKNEWLSDRDHWVAACYRFQANIVY